MRRPGAVGRSLVAGVAVLALCAAVTPARAATARPTATLVGPAHVGVGIALTLTPRAHVRHGRRLARFTLAFGDGSKSLTGRRLPSRPVKHVYRRKGRFVARLTVVDDRGRRATATVRITVNPPVVVVMPRPPVKPPGVVTPPTPQPVAPVAPLDLDAPEIQLAPGSAASVGIPAPLASVTSIDAPITAPSDLALAVKDDHLSVSTSDDAQPGTATLTVTGAGCTADGCGRAFTMRVPVTVRGLEAPSSVAAFTEASPARVAAAKPIPSGGSMLQDELIITLGTPDSPGTRAEADAAAAGADGVVSGGIDDIGVFEVRWTSAQDLGARRAQLLAQPNVTAVSDSSVGTVGTDQLPPGDWSDDGPQAEWPFIVTRAPQAWDLSQGSDVKVGIVDGGQVLGSHEDLNVVQKIGNNGVGEHATHVAGLACARANGIGLVGFAWGCPIVTSGWNDDSDKGILQAATDVAQAGAKVINMSLGYVSNGCATASVQQSLIDEASQWRAAYRQLFRGAMGRNVVWTISAGNNCAEGVPSPYGENSDLGNVITVAATNSDGKLASFSDFGDGVEVAAPGGMGVGQYGDGASGIWSTTAESCYVFFHCQSYGTHIDGGIAVGTSMAAPEVAGIAALVRSKHPDFGASRAAGCITGSAGESVGSASTRSNLPTLRTPVVAFSGSIPIVNAEAAVTCASLQFDGSPGTGSPPSTLGGYPMTAFGPDSQPIGDVSSVPDVGGTILFSPALAHRTVPSSWRTWSHGYTGDVYFTGESSTEDSTVTIDLPPATKAFAFDAEPNTFGSFTVEAIAGDGTSSEPIDIEGDSGARYFGFYGSGGQTVASITVSASDPLGFAIGEFSISR
jgi:hypothetical protein